MPKFSEMRDEGASGYTYRNRFNGWRGALLRAGLVTPDGFTPVEMRTFDALRRGPLTIGEIQKATERGYSSTTSTLSQLRKRGLVERIERRSEDWWAPRVTYRLSKKGRAA